MALRKRPLSSIQEQPEQFPDQHAEYIPLTRHLQELREADQRFHDERDRRYTEVALEREKALKIKETADETARLLVAQNQAYRDEKANELRSQIERERGNYVTRSELAAAEDKLESMIKPLLDFMAASQGGKQALIDRNSAVLAIVVIAGFILTYLQLK